MNYSRESSQSVFDLLTLSTVLSFLPRLLALFVLAIYGPAIICAALLVALTSPGPAFVKKAYQRGDGSDEVVYLYELRTECWQTWQPTPMGRFLAMCDVHRLPRLLNVLQGEVNVGERVQRLRS